MHLGERGDEHRLGDEIAVGDGIERILEGCGESELGCYRLRVERQAGSCERAGAQGRHIGAD